MAGMNLALFNSQTGMAVADRDLPQAIAWTLANRAVFQPRSWFLHNSGSIHSTRKLNEIVKGLFQTWGYEWGEDIPPMGSSGAKRHIRPADYERFRDDLQWMLRTFQSVGDLSTIFSND
jgi:nucleoside-diphosphate-sugar epimerase